MKRLIVGTVLGLVLCGGCARDEEPETADVVPSQAPSATASAPTGHEVDDLHEHGAEEATSAEQNPVGQAKRFLRAWARPALAHHEWWEGIEPLLSDQGRQAYRATDPSLVPAAKFSGTHELEPGTVATSAVVHLETTQGTFGFHMTRASEHGKWLVSRVYFPGSADD